MRATHGLNHARRAAVQLCLAVLLALTAASCFAPADRDHGSRPPFIESGDLDEIRKRGTLRVLLPSMDREGFLPRGEGLLDFERDLVETYARQQGLEPFWIHVDSREELIPYLLEGKGDLVAANLTVTPERRQRVEFTVPVRFVREQLVTRRFDSTIQGAADLAGRHVAVRRSSSFWPTLQELREKFPGIVIQEAPENLDTDELIHRVATRRLDVTVADSNVIEAAMTYRDDVRVAFDLTDDRPVAWAVRPESSALLRSLNLFLAEAQLTQRRQRINFGDLDEIKEQRVLRVITRNSAATYFLWRGKLMGFEYELGKRFADRLGIRLEVVVPQQNEDLQQMLIDGRGDIVAAAINPDDDFRRDGVAYSRPYNHVSQVIVARAGEPALTELSDLTNRAVFVRHSSAYWKQLDRLRNEYDFSLQAAPEDLDTEEIIGLVADGTYDLTVAHSHILDIELTWREDVAAAFTLGDPIPVTWAVRDSNPELLAAVDEFLEKEHRSLFYNVIYQRYFRDPKKIRHHPEFNSRSGDLSPYDGIVKRTAEPYGFDWRLIVAQIYQESEFDAQARSFAGAVGLLQVLPRTGLQLGLTDLEDPATNIEAGIRYLDWVRDRFEPELPFWERMWFSLAAYNAGAGHVTDARRLAEEQGWDPDKWFDNVERAMLLLSRREYARQARHGYCRGREPVNYVREIRERYEAYLETLAANAQSGPARRSSL
jgi:membrane-bound lytic murein transglycosylase F